MNAELIVRRGVLAVAFAGLLAFLGAAVLAGFAAFFAGDFAFPAIATPRTNHPRAATSSS